MRRTYTAAAFGFVAFAVWGSLFPFELRPLPLSETLTRFVGAWQAGPSSWSRSDFISNVILFVPIGLFGAAAVDARWPGARVRSVLAVVAAASVVSLGVELAQASVLWRTSSVVDVLGETLGALGGVVAWRAAGERFDEAAGAAEAIVRRAPFLDRALLAYAAMFAVAWLLPLDFTLRPNEIADKFAHKRLLLPFMPSPDALSPSALLTIVIAAMPLGTIAVRLAARTRQPVAYAMRVLVAVLCVLEAAQTLVFSRTTDTRGLLAALAGAFAGAAWARIVRSGTAAPLRSGPAS